MLLRPILYVLTFLVCVAVFAKARSRRLRQSILLVASYGLYLAWGIWFGGGRLLVCFGAVLLASTVMNFLLGKWLRRKPSASILTLGILLNLALLGSIQISSRRRQPARSRPYRSSLISLCRSAFLSGPSRR